MRRPYQIKPSRSKIPLKIKKRLDTLLVERGLFETRAKAQAALLAGVIHAPNDLDPMLHPAAASTRRNAVLDRMASLNLVTLGAAGAAKHLVERAWDRWILIVILSGKLAYEQLGGHEQPLVVVDAHLYGALCGFALGAALSGRTAIIRHRSSA